MWRWGGDADVGAGVGVARRKCCGGGRRVGRGGDCSAETGDDPHSNKETTRSTKSVISCSVPCGGTAKL